MDQGSEDLFSTKLTPERVRRGLGTQWLGKQEIYCLGAVASTNSEARGLALQGAPEGTIILAEAQTKGRGRSKRSWFSPSGKGLYLSLILRPQIRPEWSPQITLTAGVALAASLSDMGIKAELKWPNDVMIGGRKVAGILSEGTLSQEAIGFVIVGVGVNVNTGPEEFPSSIREHATSLRLATGKVFSRATLLQGFLVQLEGCYKQLCQGELERILQAWRRYETIFGQWVEVCLPDSRLSGVAEDLDGDGALLLRDKTGQQHRILAGDVRLCRVEEAKPY